MEALFLGRTQLTADRETLQAEGLSENALLERAIEGLFRAFQAHGVAVFKNVSVHVLVGPGNNGADALGVALKLHAKGFKKIELWKVSNKLSNLALPLVAQLQNAGLRLQALDALRPVHGELLVIDGVFGVGFKGELLEPIYEAFKKLKGAHVWAIDIPSGVDADTGLAAAGTLMAERTLSVGLPKYVLRLPHLREFYGQVTEVDIGLKRERLKPDILCLEKKDLKALLPKERVATAHKKSFGKVQVAAGSEKYPWAGYLTALGAFKAGCGFIVADSPLETTLQQLPEVVPGFQADADAFVLGPGWDAEGADERAADLLKKISPKAPVVLDGGALRAFSKLSLKDRPRLVLTPHEGEMAALLGGTWTAARVHADRLEAMRHFAKDFPHLTLLLKGSGTLIHSGGQTYLVPWGSVAMATAGQGDLLAGVIASYLAQGLEPLKAALLGASLCALAGDELSQGTEPQGVLAHEVAQKLPSLVGKIRG